MFFKVAGVLKNVPNFTWQHLFFLLQLQVFHFYTHWKRQKTKRFLLAGIEVEGLQLHQKETPTKAFSRGIFEIFNNTFF